MEILEDLLKSRKALEVKEVKNYLGGNSIKEKTKYDMIRSSLDF